MARPNIRSKVQAARDAQDLAAGKPVRIKNTALDKKKTNGKSKTA